MPDKRDVLRQNKINSFWRIIRAPISIGGLAIILFEMEPVRSEWYLNLFVYIFIVFIIFFLIAYRSVVKNNYKRKEIFLVGILAGNLLGLIIAIYKLIKIYKVWTFFNLISEPILMGLAGGCLSIIFSLPLMNNKK